MSYEYEYECYDDVLSVADLNDLGRNGWELCGLCGSPSLFSNFYYVFKRKKPIFSEAKRPASPAVEGVL